MTGTDVTDEQVCEGCGGPETPGDPFLECYGGIGETWHVGCHQRACQSMACAKANDPEATW